VLSPGHASDLHRSVAELGLNMPTTWVKWYEAKMASLELTTANTVVAQGLYSYSAIETPCLHTWFFPADPGVYHPGKSRTHDVSFQVRRSS
jgi:hypothetical protein